MKKFFLALCLAVLIAFAGGYAYISNNKAFFIDFMNTSIQQHTGHPLHIDTLPSASFFPLGLYIEKAAWGAKDKEFFIQIQGLTLALNMQDLIFGDPQIRSAKVEKVDFHISKDAKEQNSHSQNSQNKTEKALAQSQTIKSADQEQKRQRTNENKQREQASQEQKLTNYQSNQSILSKASLHKDFVHLANTISVLPISHINIKQGQLSLKEKGKQTLLLQNFTLEANKSAGQLAKLDYEPNLSVSWPKVAIEGKVEKLLLKDAEIGPVDFEIEGANGLYALDSLQSTLFGGSATTTITLKLQKPEIAIEAENVTENINLSLIPKSLTGLPLDGAWQHKGKFTTQGHNPLELKQKLQGEATFYSDNIRIDIGNILPNAKVYFTDSQGKFIVQNGIGNFNNAYFKGEAVSADITGTVNFPHDFVDILLSTNFDGLKLPFTIKGPFSSIRYGIQPASAAQNTARLFTQGGQAEKLSHKLEHIPKNLLQNGLNLVDKLLKK